MSCYLKVFGLFIDLVNLLTAFLQYGTSPKHSRVGLHDLETTGKKDTLYGCCVLTRFWEGSLNFTPSAFLDILTTYKITFKLKETWK